MKPIKQKKITIALDAYPDVQEMLEKAKEETKRTQTSIIIEAAREWNERHRSHAVKHNGSKEHPTNLEKQIADLKVTPSNKLSERELHVAKQLKSELEKPKRKRRQQ